MYFCMNSLTLSYDMLYTLLCNMHTLKVLERRDCNGHRNSCNCTLEVPRNTLHCYSNVSSHFKSYSHIACSMLVTYTTQPTHFARHLHTGHHDTKRALSAADKRSTTYMYIYETQTCYSGPTTCMNPSHFNLIHHLHHLSHACTLITQPTITTDNVHYRTPQGTSIGLVHTHHVTSSGIQLVLVDDKPYHISMSFLSSPVDHVESFISSAME